MADDYEAVTYEGWLAREAAREAALAALRAETTARLKAEREWAASPARDALRDWLDYLTNQPFHDCTDCATFGERCEGHVRELEVDTGMTDRRMTATGVLSDDRVCLWCAGAFKAPERRGKPPVTCSAVCARSRSKALDRARKAKTTYELPEAVRDALEALDDGYGRPLPVRTIPGLTWKHGFSPLLNLGADPDEGATVPGLRVIA